MVGFNSGGYDSSFAGSTYAEDNGPMQGYSPSPSGNYSYDQTGYNPDDADPWYIEQQLYGSSGGGGGAPVPPPPQYPINPGYSAPGTAPTPGTAPQTTPYDPMAGVQAGSGWLTQMIPQLYQGAAQGVTGAYDPYMQQAGWMLGNLGGPLSLGPAYQGIGSYMNPYTDQVINRLGEDVNRQLGVDLNRIGGDIAASRAFGQRGDLMKTEAMRNAQDVFATQAANLRNQGWNTALGASQDDLNRRITAYQAQGSQLLGGGQALGGLGNQAYAQQLQRAGALSRLADQGYGLYNDTNTALLQQGQQQQQLQQNLINSALQEWAMMTGYPMATAGGQMPTGIQASTTQSGSPGFWPTFGNVASAMGGLYNSGIFGAQ
jgi:hypothetical protein